MIRNLPHESIIEQYFFQVRITYILSYDFFIVLLLPIQGVYLIQLFLNMLCSYVLRQGPPFLDGVILDMFVSQTTNTPSVMITKCH